MRLVLLCVLAVSLLGPSTALRLRANTEDIDPTFTAWLARNGPYDGTDAASLKAWWAEVGGGVQANEMITKGKLSRTDTDAVALKNALQTKGALAQLAATTAADAVRDKVNNAFEALYTEERDQFRTDINYPVIEHAKNDKFKAFELLEKRLRRKHVVQSWKPAVKLGALTAPIASQVRGVKSNEEFRTLLKELVEVFSGPFADDAIRVGVRGSSTGDGKKYRPNTGKTALEEQGEFRQGVAAATDTDDKVYTSDLDIFADVPLLTKWAKDHMPRMTNAGTVNLLDFLNQMIKEDKANELKGPKFQMNATKKKEKLTALRDRVVAFSDKWHKALGRKCDVNLSNMAVLAAQNPLEANLPLMVYPSAYPSF